MRSVIKDYFSGFEGEAEITFVRKDAQGDELAFTLWYGYFYEIMEPIEPGPTGWTGLALPYHTVTGWYDDNDWLVPNPAEVAQQLDAVERGMLKAPASQILDELVAFIREGIEAGDALHIQYF